MTIKEQILVNVTSQETRVAVLEQGVLQELHLERAGSRGLVGNIFKGKIARVLPGMQAAFVDIGLDKNGFLHAGDIARIAPTFVEQASIETPLVQKLVREGETVMVQVIKDPVGSKGARLTTQLSIPARNLVLMPYGDGVGVSQKIETAQERGRLNKLLQKLISTHEIEGGMIIRTLAESASDDELEKDIIFLKRLWQHINIAMKNAAEVEQIHEDVPLTLRSLRDLMHVGIEKVLVDSNEVYDKAQNFANEFMPEITHKIERYKDEQPLFNKYAVEQEIKKALDRKVMLESGGHLIIDQTEAMTTIDVNTGSYVGQRNNEDTFFKTNIEAVTVIAHQLRLRNSGGIIIVDFIDMQTAKHKKQVLRALESAIAKDRIKIQISDMSPLGLVEITRKRTWESLEQMMCEPCEVCDGRGMIKTVQTVCYEILREVVREDRQFKARGYTIVASSGVIDLLLDEEASSLKDLQEFIKRPISLQVDALYFQQQYDIVLN